MTVRELLAREEDSSEMVHRIFRAVDQEGEQWTMCTFDCLLVRHQSPMWLDWEVTEEYVSREEWEIAKLRAKEKQ